MKAWPQLKTARQLVEEGILPPPISEKQIAALARKHQVGKKLGRTIVFQPEDVAQLLQVSPCP